MLAGVMPSEKCCESRIQNRDSSSRVNGASGSARNGRDSRRGS